jgi:hypothetical protein
MKSLDKVRERVESGEYDDKDVKWLLQEVDRYRAIDKALIRVIGERNTTIITLSRRVRMYEHVRS